MRGRDQRPETGIVFGIALALESVRGRDQRPETRDQRPDNEIEAGLRVSSVITRSIIEELRRTLAVTPTRSSLRPSPIEGKGDRFAVDEVRDSPERPLFEDSLQLCYLVSGLWFLPLTLSS